MKTTTTAYLLWLLCLVGICGIHRFYTDRPLTGLLWLFTGGLCFIGQFIDLLLIPQMVEETNIRYRNVIQGLK